MRADGPVPLADVRDETAFGGKAAQLGAALRAGLPVPDGFAFAHDAPTEHDPETLRSLLERLGGLVAIRSSAIGEDSATASFAGQHATVLGLSTVEGMLAALDEVHASARTEAARSYRSKLGLDPDPKMGVVVQRLVRADVAGVLFSRDPLSREDVRVIEVSWGLGEAVVQGIVTPDRYRVARGGRVLERVPGEKDRMIRWAAERGTEEIDVTGTKVHALCLADADLARLDALTSRCEAVFGGAQDLEIAFAAGELFLLQRRAITRG